MGVGVSEVAPYWQKTVRGMARQTPLKLENDEQTGLGCVPVDLDVSNPTRF